MAQHNLIGAQRLMDAVSALHSIGRDMGATLDMRGLLRRIIQHAVDLLAADAGGSVSLYYPASNLLIMSEAVGPAADHIGASVGPGEGLVGRVYSTGQAIAVDDYQTWEGRYPGAKANYRAVLGVPLRWQDEIIGTLMVGANRPGRHFSEEDVRVAEMFGAQAALAIGNMHLFESTRRRIDQLDRLRAIALGLLSSPDVHSILRLIAHAALEPTGAQDVHLYLYDQARGELHFGASLWSDGTEDREFSVPRQDGLTMTVARTGQRRVILDPKNDPSYKMLPDWAPLEALISVPLRWGSEVLGVFNIAFDRKVALDQDLLHFLDTLAAQAAVAIHNTRMYEATARRAEEFERLRTVAVEVLSATDISTILVRIAREGVEYAHAQDVRIYLYDQLADRLTFGASMVDPAGKGQHEERPPRPNGLTMTVARTGERMLITDPGRHPLFGPQLEEWKWEFQTIVGVPLKRGDEVIGVFNVIFEEAVSEETLRFLDLLAAQAAVAIHNARLFGAIERRAEEYSRLREVALDLLSSPDVQETMRTIARATVDVAKAEDVHIYLYNAASDELTISTSLWRATGKFDELAQKPRPGGLTATVARTGERIVITDPDHHPLFADQKAAWSWDFRTIVGVPLKQGETVVGVMNVLFADRVSEEMLHYLDLLAAQAVVALQNACLYEAERQANNRTQAILKAALSLSANLSIEDLLEDVLEECAQVVPFTTGSIMLLEGDIPAVAALRGYDEPHRTEIIRFTSEYLKDSPLLKQMIDSQQPVMIRDVLAYPEWIKFPETTHIRTWMGIPLITRGEVIGALSLDSEQLDAFSKEHADTAMGLAAHAAIAVENARLFDRTQDALAQLEALFKAGQQLIAAHEPEAMLQAIAGPSLEMGAHSAALFYIDPDESGEPGIAELVATTGDRTGPDVFPLGMRLPMRQFMLGRLVTEPPYAVRLIADVEEAGVLDEATLQALQGVQMRAVAIIPLALRNRLLGVVSLLWTAPHRFTDREQQFLSVLGPQLAAIVENRRLLEKTRSAEERFRDIALSTSDWLWETDPEGRLTYCSERVVESMGYTAQEMVGKLMDETFAPEDVERVRQTIREHSRRRQPVVDMRLWGIHKDGRRVYLSSSIVPMLGSRRRVLGYRGVTKDITAEHNAEQRERLAYEVGQRMTAVLSLDELASAIVTQIQQSFGYYHVHLFLYEPRTNALYVREGTGEAGKALKGEHFGLPLNSQPSLVARAARTAQPVISNDVRRDTEHLPNPYLPDTQSEAAFPLMRGERLLGVLDVQAIELGRFSPAELRTLENLSAHAAIAIENARLYEAERNARARADALLEASRAVSSTLSLREVLQMILKQCSQVLSYISGSILIYEEGAPVEVALDGYEESPEEFTQLVVEEFRGGRVLSRVLRDLLPVVVNDVQNRPDWWVPIAGKQQIQAWMGVPLIVRNEAIGILMLNSNQGAYMPEDVVIAQGLAAHASVAIENARLYQARERQTSHLEDLIAERTIEVVRERERLKAIVESAGEGIIFTGPTGEIEFVNPAWERLTGYRALDVLGRHTAMVFDNAPPNTLASMLGVLETRTAWEGEMHARRPDGSEYDAAITVAPVFEADGTIAHLVGVFRDITATKQVDRMRKKFVANVSHELRTPITNIKLFHTLVRSGPVERRPDYLQTMAGEIARLERLVEDLLDISRLDRGVLALEPQPINLNEVVLQVVRSHQPRAEEHGVDLAMDLYEGLPTLVGDPERLAQVVANLINNAINYTSSGDQIGVRTGVATEDGAAQATLTVSDTGMGIAPQDLPFVFNRFFRAESARVEGIPGTGLGLSIVKEIVEMHGGSIRVESTPGEGSIFTVTLPVEKMASVAQAQT